MSTIPEYPAPSRALTGEEPLAAWQDGKQIALPVSAVIETVKAGVAPEVQREVVDQVKPLTDEAKIDAQRAGAARAGAEEAAALLAVSSQPATNTVGAVVDDTGRWWTRDKADGTHQMAKPTDANDRRLDLALDDHAAEIASIKSQLALQPPLQRQRLKRAAYDGQARRISATDPITVSSSGASTLGANAVAISAYDPRIRVLGGKRRPNSVFAQYSNGYALSSSPGNTIALFSGFEFIPTVATFELSLLDAGGAGNFAVEIDGVATNDAGYALGAGNTGGQRYNRINLPTSAIGHRVRVWMVERPFAGLIFPAGGTLLDATPVRTSSVAFLGDSITEGAVASTAWKVWVSQAAYRLGIDNWIDLGIGGTGYINTSNGNRYKFIEHANDVLTSVDGGPPDAVVIAGGINDANNYPAGDIGAAALALFQLLRAGAPDMVIIVVGPFAGYGGYPTAGSALPGARDAIRAATTQVTRVSFVDTTDWITLANTDIAFNGTVNGPHPIDGGHEIYGERAAAAILPIFNSF